MVQPTPNSRGPGMVAQALHALVSQIPSSAEAPSATPAERARSLAQTAAFKAAALSGSFTLPPGPFGMATVLPDLIAVWRIQQQLVADIAGAFGKTGALSPETMIICLFKHGGAALTRTLFAREGDAAVPQRITQRALLQLLEKIAVRLVQRITARSFMRWLPVLGALGAGAYSYYDTTQVASNAMELFSRERRIEPPAPEPPAKPPRRRTPHPPRSKPSAKPEGRPRKTPRRPRRPTDD